MPGSRIALVHDFLLDLRGAERVFEVLCDLFPEADLFTAVYDERGTEGRFAERSITTSYLQRLHPTARTFRALLPLYPHAIEALDLSGYDVVLSSSSAWAHGVFTDPTAAHVCYCYNPFRYAWNDRAAALARRDPVTRAALRLVLARWRQWDFVAAQRVDRYVAISDLTRQRISRFLARDADVLHPPVEIDRFAALAGRTPGDRYVVLSELMPHKRIDVAIEAFNRLRLPLLVIGDGPDERRLRRLAGPTVTFTGRLSDEEVARVLAEARALVVTATEEFGIAAVEAQAAGRPVVALREGGAIETVVEGMTGAFYDRPDPTSLAAAVAGFDALAVDPAQCVASARRFDIEHFAAGIRAVVAEAVAVTAERSPRSRPRSARGLALAS